MKHYFIASALVFTVGVILGAGLTEQFQGFLEAQLKGIKQLTQSIEGKPNEQWSMFWLIYFNNTIKSILIIALGAFFGVLPLAFLLVNGLLVGYMGSVWSQKASLWDFIVGILPHGIIEIPAIILACAYGLRLGVLMMKMLISIISPERSIRFKEELLGYLHSLIPVILIIVVSLTFAALIESTVTYWIVKR
jgi:stage II sporulation protein M